MVVQDLGASALERVAERADLIDLVALASDDGLVEEHSGNLGIVDQVDVARTDSLANQAPRSSSWGSPWRNPRRTRS